MIRKVHHVGIVVRDIEQAMGFWRDVLGLELHTLRTMDDQGVRAALLAIGDSEIELLEPVVTDNGVARYLERKGEGLHHICFEVDDIEASLAELAAQGVELIDRTPRQGAEGRVAFIHPRAAHGVLIELVQKR
jgi:methylmalonyl-CoA/ethylmalonyl-CoA epimerase